MLFRLSGLSPHIRGNVGNRVAIERRLGSIPAHTGERCSSQSLCKPLRVYPRTYGGTARITPTNRICVGLSPHIRGNAPSNAAGIKKLGSIPAHTGERPDDHCVTCAHRVYPRTYGGTAAAVTGFNGSKGLSPHIRGNAPKTTPSSVFFGSIPAHTGERRPESTRLSSSRVYPRTYGGTTVLWLFRSTPRGLSPHIRGNGIHPSRIEAVTGSIPAHTGERCLAGSKRRPVQGLSPHIRGNAAIAAAPAGARGSIPAHTGERRTLSMVSDFSKVYPRTYGGTFWWIGPHILQKGLSPHIRGNGFLPRNNPL